jgi:hypothetical protein
VTEDHHEDDNLVLDLVLVEIEEVDEIEDETEEEVDDNLVEEMVVSEKMEKNQHLEKIDYKIEGKDSLGKYIFACKYIFFFDLFEKYYIL